MTGILLRRLGLILLGGSAALGLTPASRVLLIGTEGATDPAASERLLRD